MKLNALRWALPALIICSLHSTTQAQVSVGPEIGFTASGLYNDNDIYAGLNYHAGVTAHFQLTDFLAIRPSLLFKTGDMKIADDYYDEKYSLNRISLPVPIMYSHIFGNNSTLFAGVGPNLMYNISGKYSSAGYTSKIEFGSDTAGQIKRFDVGLQLKGGYQFANGISLSTFFNLGLSNLSNDAYYKLKSMDAFGFSIGWMFGSNSGDYY
ncbi:MAG: porin family protein [Parafilimonas sp.]